VEFLASLYEAEGRQRRSVVDGDKLHFPRKPGAGAPLKPVGDLARHARNILEDLPPNDMYQVIVDLANEFLEANTDLVKVRSLLREAKLSEEREESKREARGAKPKLAPRASKGAI
jgi:hypothetical protein